MQPLEHCEGGVLPRRAGAIHKDHLEVPGKRVMALTCSVNDRARLYSRTARSGLSGPSVFSLMAIARAYAVSAAPCLPWHGRG